MLSRTNTIITAVTTPCIQDKWSHCIVVSGQPLLNSASLRDQKVRETGDF
jgi:hypothetical protein